MYRNVVNFYGNGHLIKSGLACICLGTSAFAIYNFVSGDVKFYKQFVMPLIHRLFDGETSHQLAVYAAACGFLPKTLANEYSELKTQIWNKELLNPIGIAAGFDKDGRAARGLLKSGGLGLIEVGSVTPLPQSGNEKPRVFRLVEDRAVINRYGFNSDGFEVVKKRVENLQSEHNFRNVLFGINLGKNKEDSNYIESYERGIELFAPFCDYIVINISSPNTTGLRDLHQKKELENMTKRLKEFRESKKIEVPLLLKVAPDIDESTISDIAALCKNAANGIAGLVISNTTVQRPSTLQSANKTETGGLSGEPLSATATNLIGRFYRLTDGHVIIIGCGGVNSGADAYQKIRAGASLIQVYTVIVFDGFPAICRIKRELHNCLRRDGFQSISSAVGADFKSIINDQRK